MAVTSHAQCSSFVSASTEWSLSISWLLSLQPWLSIHLPIARAFCSLSLTSADSLWEGGWQIRAGHRQWGYLYPTGRTGRGVWVFNGNKAAWQPADMGYLCTLRMAAVLRIRISKGVCCTTAHQKKTWKPSIHIDHIDYMIYGIH